LALEISLAPSAALTSPNTREIDIEDQMVKVLIEKG
jgi:hypothetical protein